ncbi:MAG: molybdopterin-guanine dinucleotide biosynthesis protein B [Rhodospirillaceae bacterium]|nr:molybdopterin-guanine dinucleotide biosynthesis protein B [Rhodospirillaceae bacterium]|tara:strand:+ start:2925 stop:3467 length:543 start_codon:yes stop_codon:yes gene_type:complete
MTKTKVIGIAGYSGSGKTTLISGLVKILNSFNIEAGTIKHTHHNLDIFPENHISDFLMNSGISEVMVANEEYFAINRLLGSKNASNVYEFINTRSSCDILLIEGFKHQPFPKIEIWNGSIQSVFLAAADPYIVAIAAKCIDHNKLPLGLNLKILDLDDHQAIAEFICCYSGLTIKEYEQV